MLLPRADIATETLLARLIELGWEVDDVTAYRTVRAAPPPAPIREAIKGGGFDAVLFTSSSTVRNLVGIAGKPHAVDRDRACIGPADGQDRGRDGLRVDVTAPEAVGGRAGRRPGRVRRRPAGRGRQAGEPVRRPSERRRGARRRAQVRPRNGHGDDARWMLTDSPVHGRGGCGRTAGASRRLVAETSLRPGELVLPVFVKEGIAEPQPIASMPGVVQHTRDSLRKAAAEAAEAGVGGLMLFGVPGGQGRPRLGGRRPGRHPRSSRCADVRAEVGDDLRDHGRPVPVTSTPTTATAACSTPDGQVDNDATLERYA